ncbi:hypothetical protein [Labrys neptuniae]
MALLQMENAVSVPDASGLGLSCKVSLPGLERFFEKLIDFSIGKTRQNKELEKKCDSKKPHFSLETTPM